MRTLRGRLYLLVFMGGALSALGCKKEAPPPAESGSTDTAADRSSARRARSLRRLGGHAGEGDRGR